MDYQARATLRREVQRFRHDISNPMSIISGNAQLLRELAAMMDLDADFSDAIDDILEASERVEAMLRRTRHLEASLGDGTISPRLASEQTLEVPGPEVCRA